MTVDVVEIGERQAKVGEVVKVKPLAVFAMIDEGELDWKVVAIAIDDPKAHLVNNVADVENHFPVSSQVTQKAQATNLIDFLVKSFD